MKKIHLIIIFIGCVLVSYCFLKPLYHHQQGISRDSSKSANIAYVNEALMFHFNKNGIYPLHLDELMLKHEVLNAFDRPFSEITYRSEGSRYQLSWRSYNGEVYISEGVNGFCVRPNLSDKNLELMKDM